MERYLKVQIEQDLQRKMVFLSGPRQVGKTTLARSLREQDLGYLNWEIDDDRERILRKRLPNTTLLIFDEIHKYRSWRDYLKGIYDQLGGKRQILVTGSARLDLSRRGAESLQGRYHHLRLHPLSVAELGIRRQSELKQLLSLGGFPEPYFGGSEIEAKRWSKEYRTRLIKDEITSVESIQDLGNLELLALRLPELVGSPLSMKSLSEDIQVSFNTIKRWIEAFERLYFIFRVMPFGSPKIKAVKKLSKHYHFDWTLVEDEAARFENFVALHLLKFSHFEEDTKGRELELRYFRDAETREIDFVVTERRKPILAVEVKLSETTPSGQLKYFKRKFPACEVVQIFVNQGEGFTTPEGIAVIPALSFLNRLV